MAAIDLGELARRHGVRLLLQFGSTVSGVVHELSDVDLGILLDDPSLSLDRYGALHADLQRLFPGRTIDLALLNRADPLFLEQVTDRCRLLHGSDAELRRFRLYAFKRYQDHRKYLDLERRFVARAVGAPTPRG